MATIRILEDPVPIAPLASSGSPSPGGHGVRKRADGRSSPRSARRGTL